MIKVVFALWLAGAPWGISIADSAAVVISERNEAGERDTSTVQYRNAEPVIVYGERTRPRAVPPPEDRYQAIKQFLVNIVLAMTAIFSTYLVMQYRRSLREGSGGRSYHSDRRPSAGHKAPGESDSIPRLPVTPFEHACHLKELRMSHAAVIERLLKRL
jgi:hypothetical protein